MDVMDVMCVVCVVMVCGDGVWCVVDKYDIHDSMDMHHLYTSDSELHL